MIQGYIEIDYHPMTEDEFDQFNAVMMQFTVYYYRCSRVDGREYYYCIMINDSLLSSLLLLMENRNMIVNGMWQRDGTPYGQTKTIDTETGQTIESGEPEYDFDLDLHLIYTPPNREYNEEGDLISETSTTEFKPLHGFAGWTLCNAY